MCIRDRDGPVNGSAGLSGVAQGTDQAPQRAVLVQPQIRPDVRVAGERCEGAASVDEVRREPVLSLIHI